MNKGVSPDGAGLSPSVEPVPVSPPDGASIPDAEINTIAGTLVVAAQRRLLSVTEDWRPQETRRGSSLYLSPLIEAGLVEQEWLPKDAMKGRIQYLRLTALGILVKKALQPDPKGCAQTPASNLDGEE